MKAHIIHKHLMWVDFSDIHLHAPLRLFTVCYIMGCKKDGIIYPKKNKTVLLNKQEIKKTL